MRRLPVGYGAWRIGMIVSVALVAGPAVAGAATPNATAARSSVLGGYDVTPVNGLSSASSSFTLPVRARCASSSDVEELRLGEQLVPQPGDLRQQGETDAQSDVSMACAPGAGLTYTLDAAVLDDADGALDEVSGDPASPGDRISTSIQLTSGGMTIATTIDETTGQQEVAEAPSSIPASSADGAPTQFYIGATVGTGYYANCSQPFTDCTYNIPAFSSTRFRDIQIGGVPLADVASTTREDLDEDGPVQLTPAPAGNHRPAAFVLVERHYD